MRNNYFYLEKGMIPVDIWERKFEEAMAKTDRKLARIDNSLKIFRLIVPMQPRKNPRQK